ncbi:MAG: formate--tetrahydrofolate ligase, partial [Bacteroidales bacterium]|nr:formate--tetrahydrofolate ligase [Bacteroidales bacterium]
VSIGLSEGLNRIGKTTTVVIREPSLGPVFGIKGGAAGGGYSQVVPMEDINLHFTGDFSAIEKANNLLAALIDNNIQSNTRSLDIDPRTVSWKRVMDMNDRSLRHVIVGLGGTASGIPRETSFNITAASEIMAILCLAEDFHDLKERMGRIFVGFTFGKKPIYARDLNAEGAMALLLKDAIKPNLVQTLEGNPAIIHGGPFANIAQGTNSVLATKMGLSLSDYVVTEAGFGFDLGAEKFLDIKCVSAGLEPQAAVLVATVRALKYHGDTPVADLNEPNPQAVKEGLPNLDKHIENMLKFNVCPVVAINRFASDTEEELNVILDRCKELGVKAAVADVWGKGGEGAEDLARVVAKVAEECVSSFKPMYDWSWSIEQKIETIAKRIYGASAIDYTAQAKKDLKTIDTLGLNHLAVCIAKTQQSLSDNPKLLGRPKNFIVTVRQIEIAAGAGFVVPITGNIMRMPGLPQTPAAEMMNIDDDGNISGLS